MNQKTALHRWVAAGLTGVVFAGLLAFAAKSPEARDENKAGEVKKTDWPLFGGTLQRNFANLQEKDIPGEWDVQKGTSIKWSVDLGSMAYGGPVVAGGQVYVGTNNENPRDPAIKGDKGVLMCFRESDGKFLWQIVHDKLKAGRVQDWPYQGVCSSPVVEGHRLWYVSNRCELVCADVNGDPKNPGKGKILWSLDMIGKLNVFPHNLATSSPLIVGDYLYLLTSNGVDEGHINIPQPAAPSFICVDKNKGEVVWHSNLPSVRLVEARKQGKVDIEKLKNSGQILMHGQWSSPVYAEPKGKPMIIFPGGDGWIYAFDPKKGELLWKFDCNPKDSFYVLGKRATRNDFIATPVVYEDRLYIAVGQDPEHDEGVGHLWCIDITKTPSNAEKDLSPKNDNFDPRAPVNKDSGLVWHFGGFIKPEPKTGRKYHFGRSMSTCAIVDGLVYAADLGGVVFCLDAKTGQKYWEHEMNSQTWSSPYYVDGKVFIGNDDGIVFVFQAGKQKKEPATISMGDTAKVRATPVAANGALFLMSENPTKLYCITKKR